uniref:RING-type domain-containing protein n=1 Tax=Arcella intermedia TaxID=1963864 RepID=A0A6B2LU47_9EUKA
MDLCIEAQANPDHTSGCDTPCNVAWGNCSHAFHFCCISRWLKTRSVCPLCNKDWDFAKVGKNSA